LHQDWEFSATFPVPAKPELPDWTTLDLYCDRVASAVGRLSVRVFGLGEDDMPHTLNDYLWGKCTIEQAAQKAERL